MESNDYCPSVLQIQPFGIQSLHPPSSAIEKITALAGPRSDFPNFLLI